MVRAAARTQGWWRFLRVEHLVSWGSGMKLTMIRSGGFTGQRLVVTVDTDDLDVGEPQGSNLRSAVEALTELAASSPAAAGLDPSAPGAAQPRYRFILHVRPTEQVLELPESQVPPALRPLISALSQRAQPADPA